MTIDFDKYGHCIKCGTKLIGKKMVDGVERTFITNYYDTIKYDMNDGSKMRVVFCKKCKPDITEEDNDWVMKKVYKGWMQEIEDHPHRWSKEEKKAYQDKYSKMKIKSKKKEDKKDNKKDKEK